MRSLRKKMGHAGRESYKFSFAFQAHGCTGFAEPAQGLPDGAQAMLQIARGPKIVVTALATISHGQCCWEQPLEFVCTLYSSKKDARLFSEKIFRVSLAVAVADKRKQRPYEVAAMDLDVAAFARREDGGVERRFNHELRLAAVRGGKIGSSGLALASTATGLELLTSVSATFLKDVGAETRKTRSKR